MLNFAKTIPADQRKCAILEKKNKWGGGGGGGGDWALELKLEFQNLRMFPCETIQMKMNLIYMKIDVQVILIFI